MTALVTDNLPLVAGAPNGIAKLRELIQELAIRGKLVSQDAGDESASELLAQIAAEKSSLSKPTKPLGTVSEAEQRHAVPHSWAWARLGSLVLESGAGWSPSCEPRPREGGGWGVLKVSAVSWTAYKPEENKALPANLEPRPEHEVQPGDFLVSRANTAELVARSVVVDSTPPRLMLSDKIVRLKLSQSCNRRFVNLANSCPDARRYYGAVAGGTSGSMKNVSREQILNLPVPVPPLAEQHRIVAKVDELMALCDRLEAEQADAEVAHAKLVEALLASLTQARDAVDFRASWLQLAEHFHTLFTTEASVDALQSAVLRLAMMGRLAPQVPADPTKGLDALSTIAGWRQQAVLRKEIREPRKPMEAIKEDEHPFVLPEGWKWVRLGTLIYIQSGDGLTAANMQPGEIPVFGGNGVNGRHDSFNVESPTLVIGRVGYYCGSVHITPEKAWVTDNAFITKFCSEATDLRFLYLLLKCTNLKENDSATAQPVISGSKIYPIVVGLPPIAEQRRIVSKIEELISHCDQLNLNLAQARQQHEHLASVLVEQAVA